MGKNWAIVVGINNYDSLQPLKYAKRDAEAMKAWFEDEANFDQVFLFTDDSSPIPANVPILTQPYYARFLTFLNVQFENKLLEPQDNLWFFFAGHGQRYRDQDYLMFLDSSPAAVERTAISVDYVTQRLRRCGADNVVLLIDACRDEGDRSGKGLGMEHKGVVTFYSCAANQKSWEIDELQHGSFTYSLLEGLRIQGEANCATVERLHEHLSYKVPQINIEYKKPRQNPYLKAEPPYKLYYILLEQAARIKDVNSLKYQASLAENKGELALAKQLWLRVLATSCGDLDSDAISAIGRIAQPQPPSTEPVTSSPSKESMGSSKPIPISKTVETRESQEEERIEYTKTQPFEFEYATIVNFKFSGIGKTYDIERHRSQAEFFTQDMGNDVTLEMVLIPAGSFEIGSPPSENYRKPNEEPQYTVKVPTFFMSKFEVTQEQYQQLMDRNPSRFKEAKYPVESVSWNDAVEFCTKLSQKTGRTYRLPSEAEWEYACRAGTTTPFHFGETITTDLANYNGDYTYASAPKGKNRGQTIEVGSFPPNAFGLYDMHGNVWEWCEDTWHDNYIEAPTDGSPWINDNDKRYLLRGGSWFDFPEICRSANRHCDFPGHVNDRHGFRVVWSFGRTS